MAVVLTGAIAAYPSGAEPLPEPLAVKSQLSHSIVETYVTGPHAGTQRSVICDLAGRPAVLIYAREIDPTLVALLRKLDTVAQQGKEQKMKNACVLLTTRDEDQETLQELAKREKLEATVLAATPLQSERPYFGNHPGRRDLQKEAALTVIILQRLEVQAS